MSQKLLTKSHQQIIPFQGMSMRPLIVDGDRLKVNLFPQPLAYSKKLRGQICLYNDGREWVVHRLICDSQKIFLKGDFSNHVDDLKQSLIWGLVEAIEIKSGQPVCLPKAKSYWVWAHRLSLKQTHSLGFKRKYYKLLLYALNFYQRMKMNHLLK